MAVQARDIEEPDERSVTDDFYPIWCDGCGRRIEDDEDYGETDDQRYLHVTCAGTGLDSNVVQRQPGGIVDRFSQ